MSCTQTFVSGNIAIISVEFRSILGILVYPESVTIVITIDGKSNSYPMVREGDRYKFEYDTSGKLGLTTLKIDSNGNNKSSIFASFMVI